jgi:hypothetical protein
MASCTFHLSLLIDVSSHFIWTTLAYFSVSNFLLQTINKHTTINRTMCHKPSPALLISWKQIVQYLFFGYFLINSRCSIQLMNF